jgi:hypothetical protein
MADKVGANSALRPSQTAPPSTPARPATPLPARSPQSLTALAGVWRGPPCLAPGSITAPPQRSLRPCGLQGLPLLSASTPCMRKPALAAAPPPQYRSVTALKGHPPPHCLPEDRLAPAVQCWQGKSVALLARARPRKPAWPSGPGGPWGAARSVSRHLYRMSGTRYRRAPEPIVSHAAAATAAAAAANGRRARAGGPEIWGGRDRGVWVGMGRCRSAFGVGLLDCGRRAGRGRAPAPPAAVGALLLQGADAATRPRGRSASPPSPRPAGSGQRHPGPAGGAGLAAAGATASPAW